MGTAHRRSSVYASKRSAVLGLAPLLCALYAFPQFGPVSLDSANPPGEQAIHLVRQKRSTTWPTLTPLEYFPDQAATPMPWDGSVFASVRLPQPDASLEESPATLENMRGEDSKDAVSLEKLKPPKRADFNRDIYYRNKLEFSLDAGWLPINIPFPLDVFVGDAYNTYPLQYTLVPIIPSLRWHINDVGLPWI